MTFFIDGLRSEIRTIVARFRENEYRQDMTYERLIQFAKDEGDAFRARATSSTIPRTARIPARIVPGILRTNRKSPPPSTQQVAFIDEPTPSIDSSPNASVDAPSHSSVVAGENYALEEGDPDNSVATSDLPSMLNED